jgi:hypothetical protein
MNNSEWLGCSRFPSSLKVFFALLMLAGAAAAQQPQYDQQVRAAIQNQIKDDRQPRLFAWKERKYRGQSAQIQNIVQTPDGSLSRVAMIDNKPLTPQQRAEEDNRLRRMSDPDQMKRHRKERAEDDERTRKMLSSIPDAFDFQEIASWQAPNGHKMVKLHFSPRPGFTPPSRESMVFTGMQGEVVLDETEQRLAVIDGVLFRDVNFGWGILGRLYKGGRFLVEQAQVADSHWETTHMVLHFEGKALMFKSIHVDENESSWDFRPVPPMSVAQAMQYLDQLPQNAEMQQSSN